MLFYSISLFSAYYPYIFELSKIKLLRNQLEQQIFNFYRIILL